MTILPAIAEPREWNPVIRVGNDLAGALNEPLAVPHAVPPDLEAIVHSHVVVGWPP